MSTVAGQNNLQSAPLLTVNELSVEYRGIESAGVHAVREVSFAIQPREVVGILGESGSGKSTLALSLLGLLSADEAQSSGAVRTPGFGSGADVPLKRLRGHAISAIFQEPGTSLNPVMKVGKQVAEVLHAHKDWAWKRCLQEARETIGELFPGADADRVFASYPHQLSGGQRQRILIAQAVVCHPALLIADEPTASLDATIQMDILALLKKLVSEQGMAMVFISHDPQVLRMMADRLFVMYAGRIVESGPLEEVFQHPKHPYTQALLELVPRQDAQPRRSGSLLPVIPGSTPDLSVPDSGCAFDARCPVRMDECRSHQPPEVVQENHAVRCFKYGH